MEDLKNALVISCCIIALIVVGPIFYGAVSEPFEDPVKVPDVTGLSKDNAERVLDEYGLKMGEPRIRPDQRGSHVVSQRPRQGNYVRSGRRVAVTIGAEHR